MDHPNLLQLGKGGRYKNICNSVTPVTVYCPDRFKLTIVNPIVNLHALAIKKFNYQCTDTLVSVHYSNRFRKFVYILNTFEKERAARHVLKTVQLFPEGSSTHQNRTPAVRIRTLTIAHFLKLADIQLLIKMAHILYN